MSESAEAADRAHDVMPMVERSGSGNLGLWAFLAILAIGGLMLFTTMSASREEAQAPRTVIPEDASQGRISAPPPLALPRGYGDIPEGRYILAPRVAASRPLAQVPVQRIITPAVSQPQSQPPRQQALARQLPSPNYAEPASQYTRSPEARLEQRSLPLPPTPASQPVDENRIFAGQFRNPAGTVPQGTVIPAVLETAVDSTRPGAVRALVQRDIHGFDGSRVLIHRGSRLYGEYEGGVDRGQNRALVRWTRLIRPDGVTVALDSPASDPLGRAGVRGKVDGKFLQRFGGAILQSVLDVGVGVATREATNGVIVALPGSNPTITPRASQTDIQPTLKIRHGTSVSVFVAKDLDFSSVDG